MDEYALLKIFHHEHQVQVYMYAFNYVNREKMPVEDYFPGTKIIIEEYKKCQLQDKSQNIGLD